MTSEVLSSAKSQDSNSLTDSGFFTIPEEFTTSPLGGLNFSGLRGPPTLGFGLSGKITSPKSDYEDSPPLTPLSNPHTLNPSSFKDDDFDDEEEEVSDKDSSVSKERSFFEVLDSDDGNSLPPPPSSFIPGSDRVMGMVQLVKLVEHSSRDNLQKEFNFLQSEDMTLYVSRLSSKASMKPENKIRLRYVNVLPYDETRVILSSIKDVPGSDFINANWISGFSEENVVDDHAFIATQGPLPDFFQDFWRMVWETNANIIVFLGKEVEKGMLKVDHYWPDAENGLEHLPWELSGDDSFSLYMSYYTAPYQERESVMKGPQMIIKAISEEAVDDSDIVKRVFTIARTEEPTKTRTVYQFQYGGWPDNGAPSHSDAIRKLVNIVRNLHGSDRCPIIVHCSAGIGRTGTFCTIYIHMQRILWYMNRMKEMKKIADSPVKSVKEQSDSGTASSGPTLRSSAVILKNSLSASSSFARDDTCQSLTSSSISHSSSMAPSEPEGKAETLTFNIYSTVLSLRKCRQGMVQNCDQYMFCYKAIIDEARSQGLLPKVSEGESDLVKSSSMSSCLASHDYKPPKKHKENPLAISCIGWDSLGSFSQSQEHTESLLDSPSARRRKIPDTKSNNPSLSGVPIRGSSLLKEFQCSSLKPGDALLSSPPFHQPPLLAAKTDDKPKGNPKLRVAEFHDFGSSDVFKSQLSPPSHSQDPDELEVDSHAALRYSSISSINTASFF